MSLENCPRCGRLFNRSFRDVCPVCIRDIDKEYQLCADYLRENKGAIISELSEMTGVSIKQITKFVREGRISILNAPNMSYPCESCGTLIRESNLCEGCRTRLTKDTRKMIDDERNRKQVEAQATRTDSNYKGIDRYKDRH
ncbi:flagellar protein [Paenibacillus oryzae]|uniref:Flagellar protein n=1 Tax=Paenibacillus oryzae TaxID=1844972 RepID=A0A1A5YDA9_9BACL|nr:TIGR03826 family flagellar region protein [Paenibacillus oryzae]OBR63562.1 flagellar protein [Paenibacillus oryzae]